MATTPSRRIHYQRTVIMTRWHNAVRAWSFPCGRGNNETYGRSLAQMFQVSICDHDHTGRRPMVAAGRKRVRLNKRAGTFDPKSTTSS